MKFKYQNPKILGVWQLISVIGNLKFSPCILIYSGIFDNSDYLVFFL